MCRHPFAPGFFAALDQTPWAGWRPGQRGLEQAAAEELVALSLQLQRNEGRHCWAFSPSDFLAGVAGRLQQEAHQLRAADIDATPGGGELAGGAGEVYSSSMTMGGPSSNDHGDSNGAASGASSEELDKSIAGVVSLQPGLGYRFTVGWIDRLVVYWEQHVVPNLLPMGPGTRPLAVLELGCWEGRSSCYLLLRLAAHPASRLVCVDPFELLHAQFDKNRRAWQDNVSAAVTQLSSTLQRDSGSHVDAEADSPPADETIIAAVQPWPVAMESRAREVLGGGKVLLLQQTSREVLPWLLANEPGPGSFDLIYVDGSHMCADVLLDAMLAFELLSIGGMLVFDDYAWDRYGHNPACHPKQAVDAFLTVMGDRVRMVHKGYQVMVQKQDQAA